MDGFNYFMSNNECFDFCESKEPFICLISIMHSFSPCLGCRRIPKKRTISLFCWELLCLLFFLLWCCQQRGTALCKAIYIFHHLQLIINISIILVLKYTMCIVCVFQCKHQLAARLAASLGSYVEVKVSDEELALLLSRI